MPNYGNMAVKMAVVKNLVAVKGLQVAVNFGEGGSEGSPKSGNPGAQQPHSPLIDPNVEGGEAHVLLVWRPVYTPGWRPNQLGVLWHPCTVLVYKLLCIQQGGENNMEGLLVYSPPAS